ncbi:DUF1622 domain-containing protein [Actinocorallia sp. API 0066]|uniref:DUF1622 domain-containing protein n=1 Tax=Actinocorallia sp. API 0066 TaxID=2896846 RepID=UPI001E5C71C9|nr:DUF1622 domain-containing protein [Actinocorallia sp. API 0066]MCD0449173.1 DUF1622 domain-containing protein [Actinocorallia sp. API 0066]
MDEVLGEAWLARAVDLLVRVVEAAGAIVIFTGAVVAFGWFLVAAVRDRTPEAFVPVRLGLGRFLALGLEFQLASDILRTAVAPTLRAIGELAAVAAIRTALNYFLNREIKEERAELAQHPTKPPNLLTPDPGPPDPGLGNLGFEAPPR